MSIKGIDVSYCNGTWGNSYPAKAAWPGRMHRAAICEKAGRLTDANILSLFLMVGLLTNDQFVELMGLLKPKATTTA